MQARVRENKIPHRRETDVLRGIQGGGQGRLPGFVEFIKLIYFFTCLKFIAFKLASE